MLVSEHEVDEAVDVQAWLDTQDQVEERTQGCNLEVSRNGPAEEQFA